VLFYQEDEHLLFISRNREQLQDAYRFVLPDPELVERLVNKALFQELAGELNLPVPPTRPLRPAERASLPKLDLRYPIIVKPVFRERSWAESGYHTKALRIGSPQELEAHWPLWTEQKWSLLAQQLIPGPESQIESYHVYAADDGSIAGEFTGRKIRTFPSEFGHSTALQTTEADDVAELGRSLVQRLGLRGVAKFDFKRDIDGRLWLLEVNPRFNLWHHLGAVAGVNIPALVYSDLTNQPRQQATRARAPVTWCRLSEDWRAAQAFGIPIRSWLPWALQSDAKSMSWSDPVPLLQTAWRLVSDRFRTERTAAPA
jgi:predicted ATP-grasp superfamily ATP-dependent carboligase